MAFAGKSTAPLALVVNQKKCGQKYTLQILSVPFGWFCAQRLSKWEVAGCVIVSQLLVYTRSKNISRIFLQLPDASSRRQLGPARFNEISGAQKRGAVQFSWRMHEVRLSRDFYVEGWKEKVAFRYCHQDSLIVALAVLALEKSTLEDTNYQISFIHTSAFTLAGLSAVYFRHLYMTVDSIGLIPASGYKFDQQSIPGEIFFRYLNSKRKQFGGEMIRYSRNSVHGELRVNNYKVSVKYLPKNL